VDCLTKPKFANKLVAILAGYDKDMDRLMSINPGLTSRFPESVIFKPLDPATSMELLVKVLIANQKRNKAPLDLSVISSPTMELHDHVIELFSQLSALDSWGNARDVKSMAKKMFGKLLLTATVAMTSLVLSEEIIVDVMETTLSERSRRSEAAGSSRFAESPSQVLPAASQQRQKVTPITPTAPKLAKPKMVTRSQASPQITAPPEVEEQEQNPAESDAGAEEDPLDAIFGAKRDRGVSDAVWMQLERDKYAMVAKEREYGLLQEQRRQEERRIEELKRVEQAAKDEEERQIREQQRIAAELERAHNEAILRATEEEREKEKARQKKLGVKGPCPAGYSWIKQGGGYRCAGGSHWLDDAMADM
jgi:hypothetical protein